MFLQKGLWGRVMKELIKPGTVVGFDTEVSHDYFSKDTVRTCQFYVPEESMVYLFHSFRSDSDSWRRVNVKFDKTKFVGYDLTDEVYSKQDITNILTSLKMVTHSGSFDQFVCYRDFGVMFDMVGDSYVLSSLIPFSSGDTSRSLDSLGRRFVRPDYEKYYFAGEYVTYECPNDYSVGLLSRKKGSLDVTSKLVNVSTLKVGDEVLVGDERRKVLGIVSVGDKYNLDLTPMYGGADSHDYDNELTPEGIQYASTDAVMCYEIHNNLCKNYPKYKDSISYKLELAVSKPLAMMTVNGINVDKDKFMHSLSALVGDMSDLRNSLVQRAGVEFNPNSAKDLVSIGVVKPGINGKRVSTSKDSLENIKHPLIKDIIEYRHLLKLTSTMESIPEHANSINDGKLVYNPMFRSVSAFAASARINSDPSIVQWNWNVRDSIVPSSKDSQLYYLDISQFELATALYVSDEKDKYQRYLSGEDLFASLSNSIKDKLSVNVSREESKVFLYGLMYGSSGYSLQGNKFTQVDIDNVSKIVQAEYPNLIRYTSRVKNQVLANGVLKTPFGRVRRISESGIDKNKAVRVGLNYMIQSFSAEVLKIMLTNMSDSIILNKEYSDIKMLYTVYDSVLFETPKIMDKQVIDKFSSENLLVDFSGSNRPLSYRFKSGVGNSWKEANDNLRIYNYNNNVSIS